MWQNLSTHNAVMITRYNGRNQQLVNKKTFRHKKCDKPTVRYRGEWGMWKKYCVSACVCVCKYKSKSKNENKNIRKHKEVGWNAKNTNRVKQMLFVK